VDKTAAARARVFGRIADLGGVRCCKRTGFLAILEAAAWTRETLAWC
jgi:hypothetical protein